MSESQDPEAVLREIHSIVSELRDNQTPDFLDDGPRMEPSKDTKRGQALAFIHENQPINANQIKDRFDVSRMSCLARLHNSFLVDREKDTTETNAPYVYTTTPWGEAVVESWHEQAELEDVSDDGGAPSTPWERADVKKSTWVVLDLIDSYNGHPGSSDINEDFIDAGFSTTGDKLRVAPELTKLYREGYVERPASQPYYYWLTESGEEILKKGRE